MPFISHENITTQYKEIKDLGRLIRSQRFNVKQSEGGTDLNFRITHIKSSGYYNDVEVNLKVSGRLYQWGYWRNSEERNGRNIVEMTNYPRRRNDDIRSAVRNEIRGFFKLLGVPGWKIEIKKITVAESI